MPSSTFFRLPPEKRETLLQCAREEFARVPYAQASINKIIRAAKIPRGSFYMYFEDKEDLFLYLMGAYSDELEELLECQLLAQGGELFSALLALYDTVIEQCRREKLGTLMRIIQNNAGLHPHLFLRQRGGHCFLGNVRSAVNRNLLDLHGDEDLELTLSLLVGVVGSAVLNGTLADDPAPVRARLVNILELLKRGLAKKPPRSELYAKGRETNGSERSENLCGGEGPSCAASGKGGAKGQI